MLSPSMLSVSCLLMSLALVAGCPEPTGTVEPEPSADGGDAPGPGAGPGVVVDLGCSSDANCDAGQICDLAEGVCVDGYDCSGNPGLCEFCGEAGFDCGFGGPAYCDTDAGTCRRSKATCDTCANDAECGSNANFDNKCIDGFCADGCGACPAGFACQGGGCVPVEQAGSCEGAITCRDGETCPDGQRCSDLGVCLNICSDDTECGPGEICSQDPGPLLGICISGCPPRETLMSNGETLICHANGRFGSQCADNSGCPSGLECETDIGYCASPGCQSSADCPLPRTYCNVATGECVDGCETEDDCGAFELCEENTCVKQGCRGKDVSCGLGEWCCGHEFYDDPSTCPTGVEEGSCFLTPDPWCRTCEDDDDCADIDRLGYASHCYELQQEDENGETVSLGKFCSVGCNNNVDCPRGLQCAMDIPTPTEGETTNGCLSALCAPIAEAR